MTVNFTGMAFIALAAALAACATPGAGPAPYADQAPGQAARGTATTACNAAADASQAQYIIGYGSLMQDESRKRTAPKAGPAYPVVVKGYRRGWFAKGSSVGFDTTYLGVVEGGDSQLNAVIYQVDEAELTATDKRESFYCRQAIPAPRVASLTAETASPKGQIWIYVNKPEGIATPNSRYPIVQSYVDIFVSGCLEQEQRFALEGFARQCLATTTDWSRHWVNDRIYPRRPFIHQPKAGQIDKLLSEHLPQYFSSIRIESGQ